LFLPALPTLYLLLFLASFLSYATCSRVIALNLNPFGLRWKTNSTLTGESPGTPVISSDGHYVYMTRNSLPENNIVPTRMPSVGPSEAPTESQVPSVAPSKSSQATNAPVSAAPANKAPVQNTNRTLAPATLAPATFGPTPLTAPVPGATGVPAATPAPAMRRKLQAAINNSDISGFFTMFSDRKDGAILYQVKSDPLTVTNNMYSPVAIAKKVVKRLFGEDTTTINTNDVVIWHSRVSPDPTISEGVTQMFQIPNVTVAKGEDPVLTGQSLTVQGSSVAWTTIAAPTITSIGDQLFIGASDGTVREWQNGAKFDVLPSGSFLLEQAVTPPLNEAVLGINEDVLYITSSVNTFYAIKVASSPAIWSISYPDTKRITTRPVLSPDGKRVYYAAGSEIYSKTTEKGEDTWTSGTFQTTDGEPIKVNFALSENGRVLFFIGVKSNFVTALRVAQERDETSMPSSHPSGAPSISPAPIRPPITRPTFPPVTSKPNAVGTNKSINTGVIAGGVIGAIAGLALIGAMVYFFKKRFIGEDDRIDTSYQYNPNDTNI
jgi:hypothetical protein